MKDLIVHEGIGITEPVVFGLDSTFGFTFLDNSQGETNDAWFDMEIPLVIGGKQGSITDESMVCRVLGLNITFETFWRRFSGRIKGALMKARDECLGHLDLNELEEAVNNKASLEESCFTNISRIKM